MDARIVLLPDGSSDIGIDSVSHWFFSHSLHACDFLGIVGRSAWRRIPISLIPLVTNLALKEQA